MYWWVAGIVVALVALQLASLLLQRRYAEFDKAAMGVQSLATAAALLFAGYWFLYERKGQPQANTRLEVVGLKVAKDAIALEARFTLTNLGTTLLDVGETDVRLQQMNAGSLPVGKLLKLGRSDFPAYIDGADAYDDGMLMWPTIRWFKGGAPRSVEPGETDIRTVDLVTSCQDTALRLLFMMRRPGTEQLWQDQATLGVADLCRKTCWQQGDMEQWSIESVRRGYLAAPSRSAWPRARLAMGNGRERKGPHSRHPVFRTWKSSCLRCRPGSSTRTCFGRWVPSAPWRRPLLP